MRAMISMAGITSKVYKKLLASWAQLFEGRLALNPELNLTGVSFSCVLKHFLR